MKRKPTQRPTQMPTQELLRSEAEARMVLRAPGPANSLSTAELLHELRVHQIELEMQNEQLRLAQLALEESRDHYVDLYLFAPVGYLTLTRAGRIADINLAGASLLGLERKQLLLQRFDQFVAPADMERWQRLFIRLKKAEGRLIDEFEVQPKGGVAFHVQVDGQRNASVDNKSPVVRLVLMDLAASQAASDKRRVAAIAVNVQGGMPHGDEAEAWQQALTDPLTHLPNRRLMMDRLYHAMTAISRTKKCWALLFIDLDKFKALNDTLGHDIGDQLLVQVAQRLTSCVREGDTVARYGGDEFVVLLENLSESPEESANQARSIGEKIAAALNRPFSLTGNEYLSSASIGATIFNNPQESPEELLKRADLAMYEAKAAGRNALRFFDPAMQAAMTQRSTLESELRQALDAHQLRCHFQLQMDDGGHIPGAEVLLRWQHPQRGLTSPAEFIRVAEETGLLVSIGQWVLEMACEQLKKWQSSLPGRKLQLAVNVGPRQFHQANFVDQLRSVLAKTGIDPGSLTLEFKEKTVLADVSESVETLAALKKLGVRLAIDDFGIGCSSLPQLTRLPLDQLKIDPSIVHDIGVKPSDRAIVQSLIEVGNHLGMEVIAEGVETEAQHRFLGHHGCHTFQGYLFGRPVPGAEFEQLLALH